MKGRGQFRAARTVAPLTLACLLPSLASAQTATPPPADVVVRDQRDEGFRTAAAPANLPFAASVGTGATKEGKASAAQLILDATAKEKVGTLALGWKTGHENVQLALSGPLDSNSSTEPLSTTGLAKGASARLSINRYHWKAPTDAEQKAAEQLCRDAGKELKDCSVRKLSATDPALSARLAELEHLNDKPWLFGAEASVDRRGFQFLDRETLASASEVRTGFSAGGRVGVFAPSLGFLFAAYSYRRDYEAAAAPSNICRPLGDDGALRCQQVVVGAPTEANQSLASLELRRLFRTNVGISPSVQYDFEAERWLLDVPLYVVPGSGKISGGIRFGWRSDTKDVSAVVFVGTIFELFGS